MNDQQLRPAALLLLLAIAGCRTIERDPSGRPVPLTVAEVVAGSARQGVAVGASLPEGLATVHDGRHYLPVERWKPFMRALAHLDGGGRVVLLEGVFEDEEGLEQGDRELAAAGVRWGRPIGGYLGRFRNWGAQTHRVHETYDLVLYDTNLPGVYLATQGTTTYSVIHAASADALRSLEEFVPLEKRLRSVDDPSPLVALDRLRAYRRGVVPPEVEELEQTFRAEAEKQRRERIERCDARWASREADWARGDALERVAIWEEIKLRAEPPEQLGRYRERLLPELVPSVRAHAASRPLAERYAWVQYAADPAAIARKDLDRALAAAGSWDQECVVKGEALVAAMRLSRASPEDAEVAAVRQQLLADLEARRDAAPTTRERKHLRKAQKSLGPKAPSYEHVELVGKELDRLTAERDPFRRAALLLDLRRKGRFKGTVVLDLFERALWPLLVADLEAELLAAGDALEKQDRPARACWHFVQAGLLRHLERVPQDVLSFTKAAQSTDRSPFARARRAAVRALCRVEPPLSVSTTHSYGVAERLTQPPWSDRMQGYVLGLLPEGVEDLRVAARTLGVEVPWVDVGETAKGLELTTVATRPSALHHLGFDSWADHYFPLPADLRAQSVELKKEEEALAAEFAAIAKEKEAIQGAHDAIARDKAAMARLSPAAHNARVPGHNAMVSSANARVDAYNRRNDAYKKRQAAYNAKVPVFNKRLAQERWGKVFAFRKKLDAAIKAFHARRIEALHPDERAATRWLVATGYVSGGPSIGTPRVRPPAALVERELAWIAGDAFKHVDDREVLSALGDYMTRLNWVTPSPNDRLARLAPLIERFMVQRDPKAVKKLFHDHWAHYNQRDAVLKLVDARAQGPKPR